MDKKILTEVPDAKEAPESAPDIKDAERVMNNIMDTVGVGRASKPLAEVVHRVKKRRRIYNFLTVTEIVLVILIVLSSFVLFMRGYITNVTVNHSSVLTEPVAPPRSEDVRYRNGALEIRLVPGALPLDYSTAAAVRVSDGAELTVYYDTAENTVYIPCDRETDDYSLTVCDTQGIPYTFTMHIYSGN